MVKVIFFDVGDVLMREYGFKKIYEEFGKRVGLPDGVSEKLHVQYMRRLNHGRVPLADFFAMMKKQFHATGDLKRIWVDIAMKHLSLSKGTMKIVDKLHHRYSVVILSNVGELREAVDRKLGLYEHFDSVLLSYALKMRKPNKNIFRYALRHVKAMPEETVFIDDRERNLKVARKLGMKVILYKNDKQLVRDLKTAGASLK